MKARLTEQDVRALILRELPRLLETDAEVQQILLRQLRSEFAGRQESESRFEQILQELQQDRQEQRRQWEEYKAQQAQRLEEFRRQWEEYKTQQAQQWEEYKAQQTQQWEEYKAQQMQQWEEYKTQQAQQWEEYKAQQAQRLEEFRRQWEEYKIQQAQRWEELLERLGELRAEQEQRWQKTLQWVESRLNTTLSALGARWGLYTEASFRNALKGILEQSLQFEVIRWQEFDEQGEVFGRPDQVELDILIKNGLLILCEIKSSMSRSDMYTFIRKVEYYQKRHNRKADRLVVISPMVEDRARRIAEKMGVEVYSHADDVPLNAPGSNQTSEGLS